MKLTVVIRDITTFIHLGDSPSYRTVVIELTEEQRSKLTMHEHESISTCILELTEE